MAGPTSDGLPLVLTPQQIAGYVLQPLGVGGLQGEDAAIAVAIAMAESSGNTRALNAVPPDLSYGLWQINMIGDMGPARRKQFGINDNKELYKPDVNARAMIMVKQGQGWNAWSVYKSGKYLPFMPAARQAVAKPGAVYGDFPEVMRANPGGSPLEFVSRFVLRLGMFFAGTVLLIIGILLYAKQTVAPAAVKAVARNVQVARKVVAS